MNQSERMKKYLLSLLTVVLLGCVLSEKSSAQFRYGPVVGIDLTNIKFSQPLMTVDQTPGFTAGIMGEMMFPGIGFGFDLGLYYQMLGAKLHMGEREIWSSQGFGTERCYLHTMTIPIHLRFKYTRLNGFEEKLAPLAFFGPSFDFTLAHTKLTPMNFPNGNICLEFGIGAEIMQKWQVTGSYSLGTTYCIGAKYLTNYNGRNRVWSIRAAYLF